MNAWSGTLKSMRHCVLYGASILKPISIKVTMAQTSLPTTDIQDWPRSAAISLEPSLIVHVAVRNGYELRELRRKPLLRSRAVYLTAMELILMDSTLCDELEDRA